VIKATIQGLIAFLLLHTIVLAYDNSQIPVLSSIANIASNSSKKNHLQIVSWNIEHLAQSNNHGCKPRTESDYHQLKQFAQSLNADIVALQEVESISAVHRIFSAREWNVELSNRANSKAYECRKSKKSKKKQSKGTQNSSKAQWSTQQKVAILIRKGIKYKRLSDVNGLELDIEGLRTGVQIEIDHGKKKFDLLALHLKSGCFVDNYARSRKEACHILARQAVVLDAWVESQTKNNKEFVLLGDFNHRISAPYNTLWRDLNYSGSRSIALYNNMQEQLNCHPYYPAPIDHILISKQLSQTVVANSELVYYYPHKDKMKKRDMLSDHCPIAVTLAL
jgi:endonuclease/exonuclease/phosphatase family metal-dependent hydrolase